MEIRLFFLGLAACVAPLFQASANDETSPSPYSGADAGIALIECIEEDSPLARHQRGALIDIGDEDASFEVIVTAAHGLPVDPNAIGTTCVLAAGADTRISMDAMWRPESRGRGSSDDWAVLVATGRLTGTVHRLRTLPLDDETILDALPDDAPVRLPLRFPPGERPCRLTPSRLTELDVQVGIFAHNCVAWAGHSGSPVVVNVADETFVLGIHLGSRWIYEDRMALEMGRYVDTALVAAIDEAIAHGRALAAESEANRGLWQRLFGR